MVSEWSEISAEDYKAIKPYLESAPVKVAKMARDLGIEVKSATLKPRVSGQIQPVNTSKSGYRIRVNRHEPLTRQRFTIAHEIAHYLLHRDQIGEGLEDTILYRSSLSDAREAEANRLAADLIMPKNLISKALRELGSAVTLKVASDLSLKFEVSEVAMKIRLGLK